MNNFNTQSLQQLITDYRTLLSQATGPTQVLSLLTNFKIETWRWFHEHGYSDREAASELKVSNTAVSQWKNKMTYRKKIGLPEEEN